MCSAGNPIHGGSLTGSIVNGCCKSKIDSRRVTGYLRSLPDWDIEDSGIRMQPDASMLIGDMSRPSKPFSLILPSALNGTFSIRFRWSLQPFAEESRRSLDSTELRPSHNSSGCFDEGFEPYAKVVALLHSIEQGDVGNVMVAPLTMILPTMRPAHALAGNQALVILFAQEA